MSGRFVEAQRAIDGGRLALFGDDLATSSTLRTLHRDGRMRGQFSHVAGLDGAAELSPHFVGAGFDDRVVRDADDGPVGAIQSHRNPSGLLKELIQFLLKRRCRFIHESTSTSGTTGFLNRRGAAIYHRIHRFSY